MARPTPRLEPGATILVTGANGYIGSTIVDILLKEGYNVRGTVRNNKQWLQRLFTDKYGMGRYETVILPDLNVQEDIERALEGAQGLIHVASNLTFQSNIEVINETIAHTLAVVQAAANVPTMKSFVLTSSASAAYLSVPNQEGIIVREDTWNDKSVAAASSKETSEKDLPYNIYAASKTEGERSMWKFARENKLSFVINTVLPAATYGAILSPEISGSTMGLVRRILSGDSEVFTTIPAQWFVDVEDCARLHIAALLDNSVSNQRLFAFAESVNWTDIVTILREIRPDNRQIPDPPIDEGRDLSEIEPQHRAKRILQTYWGIQEWTSLQNSIASGIADLS